jgi:ribonuclease D
VPAENLLTPDFVRRVLWSPPKTRDLEPLTRAISVALRDLGARAWQVRLTAPLLADAVLAADAEAPDLATDSQSPSDPTSPSEGSPSPSQG